VGQISDLPAAPSSVEYELIDGLQRLSSYFHFRGQLALNAFDRQIAKGELLELTDCDIVKELNGRQHDDLPAAIQIRLKRHFIRVEVIGEDRDQRSRYHMFKRLNTGGENLSDQEVRNCTVRLLDGGAKFMKFIVELCSLETFRTCTDTLTDDAKQKRFDQELVLRYFAFKNNKDAYTHDVGDFMTDYMEAIADSASGKPFDYDEERQAFTKTFQTLFNTLDERAFGWVNKKGTLVRGFSVYNYEAFTLGIQSAPDNITPENVSQMDQLRQIFEAIKADAEFMAITTGGGRNSKGALDNRVQFVESRLLQNL
jgi:hypothetical protein